MQPLPVLRPEVTLDWLNELGTEYLPGFLGVELLELAPGQLHSRMKLAQQHFAPNNFLHAASIVALADTTCGYATMAHLPEGAASFTTIELKSNHLGTVREGAILCVATAQHLGAGPRWRRCTRWAKPAKGWPPLLLDLLPVSPNS